MSTNTAPPRLNGNSVVPAAVRREAEFYEKLLQVRDDVFASKHPRIRLPPKILEQVAPRPPQTAPPTKPTTNGTSNGTPSSQPLPPWPGSSAHQYPSPPKNAVPSPVSHGSRPFSAMSASSGIDPVLLTKSEHLIKAETQLKRQQLERGLKDQLDKKVRADDERELIDVEHIFNCAQKLVPPVSGLSHTTTNSDGAESFDENSYYSSKADSWSPSSEVDRSHDADTSEPLTLQHKGPANEAEVTAPKPTQPSQAAQTVIDLDDEYEPTDDLDIYEPEPAQVHVEADESDYSPPPADIGPSEPRRPRGRENNGLTNGSKRHSPTGPPTPINNNRKRKREHKRSINNITKRVARSPETVVIKEEPVSPPPFEQAPSRDEPMFTADSRRSSASFGAPHSASRAPRYYEEPSSPSIGRLPGRRMERADDLRRVASLQYARRPLSPMEGELYTAPEHRVARAVSHAFADRPAEHVVYREASAAAPRYVHEHSRSPGREYIMRAQSPMVMAPPPRTIVVDQYGNKYYAAPADSRHSVAPGSSRMVEADPYYERAMTREPTMRPAAQTGLYEEEGVFRMPPPPPRRYVEASEVDMVEARPYRAEASRRPTEVEYRASEGLERRRPPHYEDKMMMGPPREYIPTTRAFSVRPEMARREIPEGYVRHESMQPGHVRIAAPRYREVSMHHEGYDDVRLPGNAPSGRRYVEEGATERAIEGGQEVYGGEKVRYRY